MRLRIIVVAVIAALAVFGHGAGTTTTGSVAVADPLAGQQLVFDDEFSGTGLDTSKWVALDRQGDLSNGESQCYRPAQAAVANGLLTLTDLKGHHVGGISFQSNASTVSTNTVSMNVPRNLSGTAVFTHDCPPGSQLVSAAIANFTISPTPYYQEVKFQPVRAAH